MTTPPVSSLLSRTVIAAAEAIGDLLPAAYGTVAGPVQLGADGTHTVPDAGAAVTWSLGDVVLAVAMTDDAATMLTARLGADSLADALATVLADVPAMLAPLTGGALFGTAESPTVDEALATLTAEGEADPVSVALDDGGVHRATVGLRLVVTPEMLADDEAAPADGAEATAAADGADQQIQTGAAGQPAAAGQPVMGPVGAAANGPSAVGGRAAAGAGAGRSRGRQMDAPVGDAHPAQFASFDQIGNMPGPGHQLSMLGDVEMGVTAELGRTKLTVRDVLGLNPGAIIELDRAAGSPVDVVVNGTLVARGEVVVIDEEFGIRVTEIIGMDEDESAMTHVDQGLRAAQ